METWTLALALASPSMETSFDASTAAICRDQRVGQAVAELIGSWSQNYAFSRVIIGADGKFGQVLSSTMITQGPGYIICQASYRLSKAGTSASMMAYVTAITQFTFRVAPTSAGYTISLEDLPDHLDGSEEQTALIGRFTVNGRPYSAILQENQRRLAPKTTNWLVGSWVSAPRGGEDGRTVCGDFNALPLYRLNGNTATIVSFDANGRYRSMFMYTTPSGNEHSTMYRARWALKDKVLQLTNVSTEDAFRFEGGTDTQAVAQLSANVMRRGSDRFVRCVGTVEDIYGG
ncbi:hypothetical protein LQ954_12290 [Sphingomonas sp. IC-11]|uniref:hypothetical protein n=1 Tax=Sphingomonas sp. IC-11 TaxID=2898528 RepID=UPI001E2F7D98|nr:hypothetical protein [Sphingomonas sp. IC-11]MCD2316930.1 hypothetical protein [Sphingomonas sp. IC-11]